MNTLLLVLAGIALFAAGALIGKDTVVSTVSKGVQKVKDKLKKK